MTKLILKAEKRSFTGRKVKRLRKEGILPANVYGRKTKSVALQVNLTDFQKLFKEAGETGLAELQVNGEKKPVLIHNVQLDPVTDIPLHVDFLQVDLKQKVSAQVPVELIGESSVEKQGLGTVVQYINEVEVEALPTDLPEKFEIDISKLTEVDQMVQIKDLPYDKTKVEVKVDPEQILVKSEPPKAVEEVVAPVAEVATEEGGPETPVEEGKKEEVSAEEGKKEEGKSPQE